MRISDWSSDVCSNNVLCFPFIFRGALDVGATTITRSMEIAVVNAIAELARQEQSDVVAQAYGIEDLSRSEEHTSELQSLMRISYAVFCLKKKKNIYKSHQSRVKTQRMPRY